MKKLLLPILILLSVISYGQTAITIDSNPYKVNPATTSTITMSNSQVREVGMFILIPSTNAGTVTINTESSTLTNSVVYPSGVERLVFISFKTKWYIKFSVDTDEVWVSW